MLIIKRKENDTVFNYIEIGKIRYYIIEIKKTELLYEKNITKLFSLQIPLYWFYSYYEFESFFSYFEPKTNDVFVIIY